jgi:hypothetical protein
LCDGRLLFALEHRPDRCGSPSILFPSKIELTSVDARQGMRELETAEMLQSVGKKSREVALVGPVVGSPVMDVVVPIFDEERSLGPSIRRIHTHLNLAA